MNAIAVRSFGIVASAALLAAAPAFALSKKEAACQAAIAKAGRAYVAAEMRAQGACKMKAAKGKKCDAGKKSQRNASKLRKVARKCGGVSLANLGSGGCAAEAGGAGTTALGECLVEGHAAAVQTLLTDEFGLAASETEVVLTGTMTQATSTLLPPANLVRYRAVGSAPLELTDLTLFCVTFAEPAVGASAEIGADGAFTLSIAAVGVPFGCFVVDETTGEQVATLVFRGEAGDTAQIQAANGTLVLGTVSLDLGTGEAVVDASALGGKTICAAGVANPVDFTGGWKFTCTPGPPGSGYGCPPPDQGGGPDHIYLHRVPGTSAAGQPIHWLGMWDSVDAFKACGQIEGLATASGGTSTAGGETLGVPDGVFSFANEAAVFAAIDPFTFVVPGGPGGPGPGPGPQPMGICNSTAQHCSGAQNNDGNACTDPQPGQPPSCWGRPDFGTNPPTFVPFTDQQCQQICYRMNLYSGPGAPPDLLGALTQGGLCVQEGVMDMSVPPDDPNAVRKTGNPVGRFLLARLQYSCDDAASVVHKFPTFIVGLPPDPNSPPGPPTACHVTERAEITLKMVDPNKILGNFKQTASLAPGDPAACADDSNPQNPIAFMLKNPMSMLFTLTR